MSQWTADGSAKAPQVCSHCKSIKKGCDKRLPSCGPCIKRRTVCVYGEQSPSPRQQIDELYNLASTLNGVSAVVRSSSEPNARLSVMLIDPSKILPLQVNSPGDNTSIVTANSLFHSQIDRLLRDENNNVYEIVARYFRSIHRWLPIISKKRFDQRLMDFQTVPAADFSLLLLCMKLITRHPDLSLEGAHERDQLYAATKLLFVQIRALMPNSVCLIQAGIIIARHEYGHGMIEAAYDSIGICARMAYATGLDQIGCSMEVPGCEQWYEAEEALSTWWGLLICDKTLACEDLLQARPRATQPIKGNLHLPLDFENLDSDMVIRPQLPYRYSVCSISTPGIGTFGREAQAVWLLDRVLIAVDSETLTSADLTKLYTLDGIIQTFLSFIMEQMGDKWGSHCSALHLTLTALYILHNRICAEPYIDALGDVIKRSQLALTSISRLVADIASAFNNDRDRFDIDVFGPTFSHIPRCAKQLATIPLECRTRGWHDDLEQLRVFLRYMNSRWSIAGTAAYSEACRIVQQPWLPKS